MRSRKTALIIIILAGIVSFFLGFTRAEARVFVGGGVVLGSPYYYYPPYYSYYPPSYPPYPPGYYPPDYYSTAPYPVPPPTAQDRYYSDNGDYCREYRHSIMVDGQRQPAYGHACRQPDGSWHILD